MSFAAWKRTGRSGVPTGVRKRRRGVSLCALNLEADVIKLDIINEVVHRTGITKTKAEMAVETVFESMKRALGKGERIELRGFGIFNVRPRKTGIGRNPRTGAEVAIPPGKAVRFKPGKELQTLE
jgi:DNA-binding protein HU-beta